MPRLVCFIYTQTNGLHNSNEFVTKKNMFEFARPVSLNYVIGYKQGSEFNETKKEKFVFKPECLAISDESYKIHKISNTHVSNQGVRPGMQVGYRVSSRSRLAFGRFASWFQPHGEVPKTLASTISTRSLSDYRQ